MAIENIDGFGHRRDRAGVRAILKNHRKPERVAAAQAKRDRKAAKRAPSGVIAFYAWPAGGISVTLPAGAYVHGGAGFPEGRYQVVIVGDLRGTVEDYRAAVEAWLKKPVRLVSCEPLPIAPAPALLSGGAVPGRSFLNVILEPGA